MDAAGLWDAPKPEAEEPISPFLIPIDEEPRRPHERVAVAPVRTPLPPARAISVPAEPPPVDVHRVPLDEHIETLLTLLRTDEIDEAIAQRDAPTRDSSDGAIRARWHLTNELIGVAKSLPSRVVQVLATAIGRDNLESARGDLVAYREADPSAARDADVVLRTKAKTIQRVVAGALYVEPVVYTPPVQFNPQPSYESPKSSGANFWWIGIVVILAVIRIALRTNSSHSYDYSYTPSYTPSYNYNSSYYNDYAFREAMDKTRADVVTALPLIDHVSPYEEPAQFDKNASPDQLVEEIDRSLFVLRENGWLTSTQSVKMTELWVLTPYDSDCAEVRDALKAWEKLRMSADLKLAKRHMKAVRQRIDTLCPATKKKAAKKKSTPVEMELTDTPPQ